MDHIENVIFFERYQAAEKLYENSVFSAYLGTDIDTNEHVLIRIMNPSRYTHYEVDKICFSNELSAIRSFDHQNIIRVFAAGTYSDTVCIVSEYLSCISLDDYLSERSTLDIVTALKFTSQLASALRYAHNHNILHRGIKPMAVSIVLKGSETVAKLSDFGMSYIVDYMHVSESQIDYDFGFMAPESTGLLDRKVDQRSDLYSLGVMLYRFLTGELPFHADSIDNMVYQHVAVTPKAPELLNPAIPSDVSTIILKLLNKDPDLRYQTANELINDIDRYLCSSIVSMRLPSDDLLHSIDQKSRVLCRKNELAQIRGIYTEALEQGGRFCLVRGALGCGKSDLFTNLCNELMSSGIPYFRAHFSAQTTMTPYHAFHDVLEDYVQLYKQYDRKLQVTERNRLARSLGGLSDIVFRICSKMKEVLPYSLALPTLEGYKEQQRSIMLLSNFFLSLNTQDKPFVLILDDIHYADASSLSLLNEMASHIAEHKVFIICSYREGEEGTSGYLSTFLDTIRSCPNFDDIRLKPFTESRMCEYLSDILGLSRDECQVLASYMLEKTDGNPYFTVNFLRSMLEDGVIVVNNGSLEQNWDRLRALNSPEDISEIISRRMERLSEEAINFLEIAAVAGYEFSLSLIMRITDLHKSDIASWIDTAISLQFVEFSSSRDIMSFAHHDVHEAFLSRLSESRKRDLHGWIARGLEESLADDPKDIYRLVYHLYNSNDEKTLRKFIFRAAEAARLANANEESIIYYTRGLELIGSEDTPEWRAAKLALTELNLTTGHSADAIVSASDLLAVVDTRLEKAQLLLHIATAYFRQSKFSECETQLIDALECLGEHFPKSRATIRIRTTSLRINQALTTKLVVDPSKRYHKVSPEENSLIASIYETLCLSYTYSDTVKFDYAALHLYTLAFRRMGSSLELAAAASALSVYYCMRGQRKLGEDSQLLSLKLRRSLNDSYGIAKSLFFTGLCAQWNSNTEESIKYLKEALEAFRNIGDLWEVNNTNNSLAITYMMCGDYQTSARLCEDIIDTAIKLDDKLELCQAYSTLITCHTETGNYPNAAEVAKRCEAIVNKLDYPYAKIIFKIAYGKLLIEQKKYVDAVHILAEARELYESGHSIKEYTASVYAYLAIARILLLDEQRNDMRLIEVQAAESDIAKICEKAMEESKGKPNLLLSAYRANALYGIVSEKLRQTDMAYRLGSELAMDVGYRYDVAQFYYEYSEYLLSKHRKDAARYFMFEAYMLYSGISSMVHLKQCEAIISERFSSDFSNNTLLADVSARRNRMNVDRKVNTLLRLGDRLTSTLELEELQRKILQDAVELVGAERGILFLYPETGPKRLYVASVFNLGSFDCNTYDWMLEEIEKAKKPIVINDVQSDEYRKHYTVLVRYGIKSVMAMPMFVRGNLFGVIYLDSRLVRQIFTEDYIETMGFIANQAGAPIENARLYHRAITDGLTGIYGRSYLDNLIMDRTGDSDVKLSAIMIDVDNFKSCNDTYGHPFGDKVLKQIAGVMKRVAGEHGVPCRYGGEEFVVLLDSNNPDFVLGIAEKIRTTVESSTIAYNGSSEVQLVSVTISLGVSIWTSEMERVDLIEHADKALYHAKQHGKNQTILWHPLL